MEGFVVWGNREPDPFHRLGCCPTPVLVLIEFCQVEGPRPLLSLPASPGRHVNLDAISLWLMSCEVSHGSLLLLRSESLSLDALVLHFTLLDISARAFQRPFCLALLSPSAPSDHAIRVFRSRALALLAPLVACNRNRFLDHLVSPCIPSQFPRLQTDLFEMADSIASTTHKNYYALCPTTSSLSSPANNERLEAIVTAGRRLYSRLHSARLRSPSLPFAIAQCRLSQAREDGCGPHDEAEVDELIGASPTAALLPLTQLAPCAYEHFLQALPAFRAQFLPSPVFARSPALASGSRAILHQLPASHVPRGTMPIEEKAVDEEENSLRSVIASLGQILYPPLTGTSITVCGGELRWPTVVDFHAKLRSLVPVACGHDGEELIARRPLNRGGSLAGCYLDLNRGQLHAPVYNGRFLRSLGEKRASHFVSDRAVGDFTRVLLTEIALTVYVMHFLQSSDSRERLVRTLASSDLHILEHLLAAASGAVGDRTGLPGEMRVFKL